MAKKKATVKITGIPQARDNLKKFLESTIKSEELLVMTAKLSAEQVKNRTRARLEEYKQEPLKKSTIERREALIRAGNISSDRQSRPKQSNLTLSGQLLDSIKFEINRAQSLITLVLSPFRRPYIGVRGKALENDKTNVEIKNDLEKIGRKFFFISDKLSALLENRIAKELGRKLSIYNRIRRKLGQ